MSELHLHPTRAPGLRNERALSFLTRYTRSRACCKIEKRAQGRARDERFRRLGVASLQKGQKFLDCARVSQRPLAFCNSLCNATRTDGTYTFVPTATLNKSVVEESVEGESVLAKLDVLADLLRLLGNHLGLFLGFLLDVLGCLGRGLLGFLSLGRS